MTTDNSMDLHRSRVRKLDLDTMHLGFVADRLRLKRLGRRGWNGRPIDRRRASRQYQDN
jgi:hypothetical protein